MIDRPGRAAASSLLREFIGGELTNDELANRWPATNRAGGDWALVAIADFLWNFYDDFSVHRLDVAKVPDEGRVALRRCQCFLDSDLPYGWPHVALARVKRPSPGEWSLHALMYRLFSRHGDGKADAALAAFGQLAWWPFRDEPEYLAVCEKQNLSN